jgi:hypothetical protein
MMAAGVHNVTDGGFRVHQRWVAPPRAPIHELASECPKANAIDEKQVLLVARTRSMSRVALPEGGPARVAVRGEYSDRAG